MAKFKEIPVQPIIVDAVQWIGGKLSEVPDWIKTALEKSMLQGGNGAIMRIGNDVHINTPRGVLIAKDGDWLVKAGDLITPFPNDHFIKRFSPLSGDVTVKKPTQFGTDHKNS